MDAFWISAGIVAIAEIGDKTQLLAILLAAKFRKPVSILAGILVATLANHFAAAWLGQLAAAWLTPEVLRWVLVVSFAAMAIWVLISDKDDGLAAPAQGRAAAFIATAIAFFLVEMGDKTQIATIALGARYHDAAIVAAGTTLGMMIANTPAVFLGEAVLRIAPMRLVRWTSAAIFAALALLTLLLR